MNNITGTTYSDEREVCNRQANLLRLEVLWHSDGEVLEGRQARRDELRRIWAAVNHRPENLLDVDVGAGCAATRPESDGDRNLLRPCQGVLSGNASAVYSRGAGRNRELITYGSVDSNCDVLPGLDVCPLGGRANGDSLRKSRRKEGNEPGEGEEELHDKVWCGSRKMLVETGTTRADEVVSLMLLE